MTWRFYGQASFGAAAETGAEWAAQTPGGRPAMPATRRSAWLFHRLMPMILALLAAAAGAQPRMPLPQKWSGRTVLPEGVNPGLTGDQFELTITSLTSDE